MNKLLVAAAALVLAAAAHAQTKQELVTKVLELQRAAIENVGSRVAQVSAAQVMQVAAQAVARVPADKREALGKEIEAEVRRFHAEIEPLLRERALALAPSTVGTLLEQRFSEDELKQIVAWLQQPVSRKYQDLGAELDNSLGQKIVTDTRQSVEGKLKTLEVTLKKRLEAAAPAASAASAPKRK
jgi:hypothetical protein